MTGWMGVLVARLGAALCAGWLAIVLTRAIVRVVYPAP